MKRKIKRTLSIILTVVMILGLFVAMPATSANAAHYSYSFPNYHAPDLGSNVVFALGDSYTITFEGNNGGLSNSDGRLYMDGVLYGESIHPSGRYVFGQTVTIDEDGTLHLNGATYSLEGYKYYAVGREMFTNGWYWWFYRTNDPSKAITAPVGKTMKYTGSEIQLCSAGSANFGTMQYKLNDGNWSTSIPTATNVGVYTIYYKVVGSVVESDVKQTTAEISGTDVYNYTVQDGSGADNAFAKGKIHIISFNDNYHNQLYYNGVFNGQKELTYDERNYLYNGPASIEADGTLTMNGKSYSLGDYNAWRIGDTQWMLYHYYYFYRVNTSAAAVNTAPTAKTLYYNGNEQQLVNAGTATNGSMHYSMDNSVWGTAIPTAADVGTYTVYYKAIGDASHVDSDVGQVNVTIAEPPTYTITWKNYDGTVLATDQVKSGVTPAYNAETPVKEGNAQYTYTFSGWDKAITAATADAVYTAQFSESVNNYTVRWLNYDGQELEVDTVPYGTTPTYDGETPTKQGNAQYSYTFSGWGDISAVTNDVTYTAQFNSSVNEYTVRWLNYDGQELEVDTVPYGTTPTYDGETPTKQGNAQYSYTFSGWGDISAVTNDVTYTAQFSETVNKYTVTWKNHDGTILETDTDVPYGMTPEYNAETPIKASTEQYTYTFGGWSPEISSVTEDITYTAYFNSIENKVEINYTDINGITEKLSDAGVLTFVGTSLELPATPYLDGYDFRGWNVNGTIYTTADTVQTAVETLVKSGSNVNIQPVYEKKTETYHVYIGNGHFKDSELNEGDYNPSTQLYVVANEGTPDQIFQYWTAIDSNGTTVIVSYDEIYAFRMPTKDINLSAVYGDKPVEETSKSGTAYIESVTNPMPNKLSFVAILSVPDDMRILRAGVVANTEETLNNEELTIDNTRFQSYNSTTCKKYTSFKYTFTKGNVQANEVWCVRAYLMYTDVQGGVYTVYGDTVKADLNGEITHEEDI